MAAAIAAATVVMGVGIAVGNAVIACVPAVIEELGGNEWMVRSEVTIAGKS